MSTMAAAQGHHQHEALKHRHKHYHVTHYLHQGENWGHLLATHSHDHNHPALEHVHIPHRDVDKEHRREAHVHDHARPRSRQRRAPTDARSGVPTFLLVAHLGASEDVPSAR